ncbi:MAG: iron-containing alcohol dehydrogenase [Candidatus Lokiarchaeota archaeon]|nr:iron-containing alcohol dehydrogenase [Candidatus Lokiarchaeota archaeon]
MWYFFGPKVVFGEEAVNYLENIKGSKCFIVTDQNIRQLGVLDPLLEALNRFEKSFEIFDEVKPDPREEDIMKGKEISISYSPDIIIALGGGSVMDTAKAIWAMTEFPHMVIDDLHPFNEELLTLGRKISMVAIPTTSGTGAEATWAMIISRLQEGIWIKLEQAHKSCVPQFAILDPVFTQKMPPKLTVSTAFDALAHSIEAITTSWRSEYSNALCTKAIELIFKWLPIAVKDGNNLEARDYLHQAANMAGMGFGNSQVHIGHAMGHSWGAIFHTPHGISVGIILKYVLMFLINNNDPEDMGKELLGKLSKKLGWAKWEDNDKLAAKIIVNKIKSLESECGFPKKLADLDISQEDLDKNMAKLIALCYQSPSCVMAPRSPNQEEYKKLFNYAYEGKDVDF